VSKLIENIVLVDYPNVHFVGDALSARDITVSGAQANLCCREFGYPKISSYIKNKK